MRISSYMLLFFILAGCREKFVPSVHLPFTGYLVVEGILNSGTGASQILLTRTNTLNDSTRLPETGAVVQVEGTDSSRFILLDKGSGSYAADQLALANTVQYRLRITSKDGRVYLSDYVPVLTTPPIDSISWKLANGGVQIYANTHDAINNTRYFQWNYTETWEFHSRYLPILKYDTVVFSLVNPVIIAVPATPDLSIYTCWQTLTSTSLLIGSSAKLSESIITEMPVEFIPQASQKLSVEYSILVNQYALTKPAYEFLQEMKMNTEETGSIFDPQPSQLNGNIHCISNASETVVGYISIASMNSTRIFINNAELPDWGYLQPCMTSNIPNDPKDVYAADASGLFPVTPETVNPATGGVASFLAASIFCIDCTLSGTNQKPSFWP